MANKLTIEDINKLSSIEFINLFKNAVELWPQAAETVAKQLPFSRLTDLVDHFVDYLENLSIADKVFVLASHPDLAGKLLDDNKLSNESAQEQSLAGLDKLTADNKTELVQSNREYSQKFGFPFVICVRQNNKIDRILEGFRERLPNSRDKEITNGIEQVKKICQLRIENIVQ